MYGPLEVHRPRKMVLGAGCYDRLSGLGAAVMDRFSGAPGRNFKRDQAFFAMALMISRFGPPAKPTNIGKSRHRLRQWLQSLPHS